jgi:hypothetical protein
MKMTFLERLHKLDRLHHLIRRRGTGTPGELAERLDVCKRTAHNLIDELRDLGAPVVYCPVRGSYYYEYEIELQLLPKPASIDPLLVKGGKKFYFFEYDARMVH